MIEIKPKGSQSKFKEKPDSHAWLVLLSVVAVPISKFLFLPALVFDACEIWFHEFGHAMIAWMSGRAATPLGIGWTNIAETPSWSVRVCFVFILSVLIWKSWLHRTWYLLVSASIIVCGVIYFSWICNEDRVLISITWSGVGGQMIIATWFILASFFSFPPRMRWDFLKVPVLFAAMYSLLDTYWLWHRISKNKASIPFGTMIHGAEDEGGDMNQMLDQWGWLKSELIQSYTQTGFKCFVLIGLFTIVAMIMSASRPRARKH